MRRIRESIQLGPSMPWTETLVLNYPESIDVDVDDDLNRELALYVPTHHNIPFPLTNLSLSTDQL